jgi:hypothetical protein
MAFWFIWLLLEFHDGLLKIKDLCVHGSALLNGLTGVPRNSRKISQVRIRQNDSSSGVPPSGSALIARPDDPMMIERSLSGLFFVPNVTLGIPKRDLVCNLCL